MAVAAAVLAAGCGTILALDPDLDPLPSRDGSAGDGDDVGDGGTGGDGCANGTIGCTGVCVDPRTDKTHCGRCGNTCNLGGCKDGGCERTVFVTSVEYNGNLGGLDGGDQKCAMHASDAGLPGTYRAWLADGTGAPIDRFSKDSAGYLLLDGGGSVATGWADLVDGMLARELNVNERGSFNAGQAVVWSNVSPEGRRTSDASCSNWTDGDAGTPTSHGQPGDVSTGWTQNGPTGQCYNTFGLYCFEQ